MVALLLLICLVVIWSSLSGLVALKEPFRLVRDFIPRENVSNLCFCPQLFQLLVFIPANEFKVSCQRFTMCRDGAYKIFPAPVVSSNYALLLRFTPCASVSVGRTSVVSRFMVLSLLQSSHFGLARAPIMWSHFPHGNEHVITCLTRLFLASCTALELIHDPGNSRLSTSLSKNSAAQVVAAGFPQLSIS